jgi:hypothetical protein
MPQYIEKKVHNVLLDDDGLLYIDRLVFSKVCHFLCTACGEKTDPDAYRITQSGTIRNRNQKSRSRPPVNWHTVEQS